MVRLRSEEDVWREIPAQRLWPLDRLLLALSYGYVAGPAGVSVPVPGRYVVRPCVNALGMGKGAMFADLVRSTDHLPPGSFWCEIFTGRHLSVDYERGVPVLVVEGRRSDPERLDRWDRWNRIAEHHAPFCPPCLQAEPGRTNAEFIGDRVVEVHFRGNPDFQWGNRVAVPVWRSPGGIGPRPAGMEFQPAPDGDRLGFWVA